MQETDFINILVVDDEEPIRRLIRKELGSSNRQILTAANAREAFSITRKHNLDIIILDINLPDGNGLDLMRNFIDEIPPIEVILITGFGDIDTAVKAMKIGAYDYITKPFNLDHLDMVVEKAYQRICLKRENRMLRHSQKSEPPEKLLCNSAVMEHIHYLIRKVSPTDVPVLLTGDSGVGKSFIAKIIHSQSKRANQPLITKNCGTLQNELIRSELFGYCKGAFTGADETREGLLAMAHKGTLFLDEIGELPMEVQASLLRVLESQMYRRVGDKEERTVDTRFIFATNRNLVEEAAAGRFSEALYHRINVFNIEIRPLRERKEEIPALAQHFLKSNPIGIPCRITDRAMKCLTEYHWPGNIRELKNVIERGIILAEDGLITEKELPFKLLEASQGEEAIGSMTDDTQIHSLKEMERRHILKVLKTTNGSRTQTADLLGIGRKTLYRKLKDFGIEE
ncbi:MAG: sigma-54 dependent transcriptional regulator [Desulfobacterales bacterium]|nr:sigma-54 dependent transcriptional regulator [Desulfobacterales bacterium]MDD4073241.1 sigma-54 dependent transcriptional regulator [Desulfobacterales bacterium]MDD4394036.1 sigma-54 dependent transcriptional regulator [Desulfobacterales bacterium]